MILYTLDNNLNMDKLMRDFYVKKRIIPYAICTIFCGIFSYIYSLFSHGVTSPHMTFLFLYPLVLGAIPAIVSMMFKRKVQTYFLATHLYHTGVVCLLLSSMLRGIFDIAGTSSIYQTSLMIVGGLILVAGFICFQIKK